MISDEVVLLPDHPLNFFLHPDVSLDMQRVRHPEKDPRNHKAYTQADYELALQQDILNAHGRIILVSAFGAVRAVDKWEPTFLTVLKRGVCICVYLQKPWQYDDRHRLILSEHQRREFKRFEDSVYQLEKIGVHVNIRDDLHEKLAIIDEHINWEGGLNFLSWHKTTENTRRFDDRFTAMERIVKHNLLSCNKCPAVPSLGQQLKRRRLLLELTQQELAVKAGVSRQTVSDLEADSKDVGILKAGRVVQALDLDQWLFPNYLSQQILPRFKSIK